MPGKEKSGCKKEKQAARWEVKRDTSKSSTGSTDPPSGSTDESEEVKPLTPALEESTITSQCLQTKGATNQGEASSDRLLGVTGSRDDASTEQFIHESQQRIRFFQATLVSMIFMTLVGLVVARLTSSDMVAVDVVNMFGDGVSFIINIMVEKVKQRQTQGQTKVEPRKRILLLDMVGGACSFVILAAIVIWGAYSANKRLADPVDNPIHDRIYIFGYAVLNLVVDMVVIWYFSFLTCAAVDDANALNLVSGVLHLCIDAARCFITIVISSFMLWHPTLSIMDAFADAVGALLLCILLGGSTVAIAVQAFGSWTAFNSLGCDTPPQNSGSAVSTEELYNGGIVSS